MQARAAFKKAKADIDSKIQSSLTKIKGLQSQMDSESAKCSSCFLHLCKE